MTLSPQNLAAIEAVSTGAALGRSAQMASRASER
jgi:hypothetical protein